MRRRPGPVLPLVLLAVAACRTAGSANVGASAPLVITPALGAAPGQPADEQVLADVPLFYPTDSTYVRIPVKLGTRDSLWFLVDLGAAQTSFWPRTRDLPGTDVHATTSTSVQGSAGNVGAEQARADSIRVGGIVRTGMSVLVLDVPAMLHWKPTGFHEPDGIVGRDMLQGYDVEFNFPARRFRIYDPTTRPASKSGAHPTWSGVRGLTCTPDLAAAYGSMQEMVVLDVTVDGHPVHAMLDTGAPRSYLTLAVADMVGLTPTTPGVTLDDSLKSNGLGEHRTKRYRTSRVQLTAASRPLRNGILYFSDINTPSVSTVNGEQQPKMLLGLNALSDRVLFIASSTGEVCLGPPPSH